VSFKNSFRSLDSLMFLDSNKKKIPRSFASGWDQNFVPPPAYEDSTRTPAPFIPLQERVNNNTSNTC